MYILYTFISASGGIDMVAVITGASGGIGKETAKILVSQAGKLYVFSAAIAKLRALKV